MTTGSIWKVEDVLKVAGRYKTSLRERAYILALNRIQFQWIKSKEKIAFA